MVGRINILKGFSKKGEGRGKEVIRGDDSILKGGDNFHLF